MVRVIMYVCLAYARFSSCSAESKFRAKKATILFRRSVNSSMDPTWISAVTKKIYKLS